MANLKNFKKDFNKKSRLFQNLANGKIQRIIGVEGENHFDKFWDNEGFTDKSLKK